MSSTKDLKVLSQEEQSAFQLILDGKTDEVKKLVEDSKLRVNCLNKDGMNLLDQACFKGDEELVKFLIENGADVDNRAHHQGYTSLMFAALAGKPSICQHINKTASELAAFVGQFECVSVISSYISYEDIQRIINPNNPTGTEVVYPEQLVQFVHNLTKTHEIHPVSLVFNAMQEELVMEHRQKILYTVDRLFEKQLRCKEPNEMMSLKLWLILFTLRELLKFMELKQSS
uniref:Uncharacterized protein n=1 Tax=Ditylenchus dipsaci TaxID=166011 RepID=A0A915EMU0_9BILA